MCLRHARQADERAIHNSHVLYRIRLAEEWIETTPKRYIHRFVNMLLAISVCARRNKDEALGVSIHFLHTTVISIDSNISFYNCWRTDRWLPPETDHARVRTPFIDTLINSNWWALNFSCWGSRVKFKRSLVDTPKISTPCPKQSCSGELIIRPSRTWHWKVF